MKKPWLASLLNLIPLPVGLGYLYIGEKRRAFTVIVYGWIATFGIGIALLFALVPCSWGGGCGGFLIETLLVLLAVIPISVLVYAARDAWRMTKRMNDEMNRQTN